jgi:hypothetical protein
VIKINSEWVIRNDLIREIYISGEKYTNECKLIFKLESGIDPEYYEEVYDNKIEAKERLNIIMEQLK